jgi:hypothetical protein
MDAPLSNPFVHTFESYNRNESPTREKLVSGTVRAIQPGHPDFGQASPRLSENRAGGGGCIFGVVLSASVPRAALGNARACNTESSR